ncbi:hypothetical protein Tco_0887801 [Tanacetum coccineum]
MYERQKKSVQDFVPIGSAKEEELIKKMNEKATGEDTSNKEKVLEEPDSTKVLIGTANEDAYTLLRFIQKQIDKHESDDRGEKDP